MSGRRMLAAWVAALLLCACGPQVATIQPWMLGGKSIRNNMGVPIETPSGATLRVAEDGTGVVFGLAQPTNPIQYDIYIEPKSEDEFWVLGDYEAFEKRGYTVEHKIHEDEAWRYRRVRDACGPFQKDTIDLATGKVTEPGAEWWPGAVCVAEYTNPEHCDPPTLVGCWQYVWCPGEPPPPQACQDRWEEERTLTPYLPGH